MKKLGFGFMRLPRLENGEIDVEHTRKMVDAFLEAGFTYFDTAHNYLDGRSELLLRETLTSRYPRERYVLTNKLTRLFFEQESEIRPVLRQQLEACGVTYFDNLLIHSVTSSSYEKLTRCNVFGVLQQLKQEGLTRRIGMSFHDTPEFLEQVLTEHPEIEVVQIQFNYLDEANPKVQSRGCYDVCRKFGKPILVMEPVKGGSLAQLPEQAGAILDGLHGGSHASYAIRYAASQESVEMVLSGMSSLEQVRDNVSFMADFRPLSEAENDALRSVRDVVLSQETIGCTGCRYCMDRCPQQIPIPEIFDLWNRRKKYLEGVGGYASVTKDKAKASDCLDCGQCEDACPQKLEIRKLLRDAAAIFEERKG